MSNSMFRFLLLPFLMTARLLRPLSLDETDSRRNSRPVSFRHMFGANETDVRAGETVSTKENGLNSRL